MGLFMNNDEHPDVFKNAAIIVEPNQSHSQIDTVSEWMLQQQEENDSLHRRIIDLELLLKQQKQAQSNQLQRIRKRLNQLQENDIRSEQAEESVQKALAQQNDQNQAFLQLLANERMANEQFKERLMTVDESSREMAYRLEQVASANEAIFAELHEQSDHYQQLAEEIVQQGDSQKNVIRRLDDQEGVVEKVGRQLDYLRQVLYERTNVFTEKIENSYTLSAAYLAKLLANAEQPMARFRMNPKLEEKQRNSD